MSPDTFVQRRFTPLGNTFLSDVDEEELRLAFESAHNKKLVISKAPTPFEGIILEIKSLRRRAKSCQPHLSVPDACASVRTVALPCKPIDTCVLYGGGNAGAVDSHNGNGAVSKSPTKPSGNRNTSPPGRAVPDASRCNLSPAASRVCNDMPGSIGPMSSHCYSPSVAGVAVSQHAFQLPVQGVSALESPLVSASQMSATNAKSKSPKKGRGAVALSLMQHLTDTSHGTSRKQKKKFLCTSDSHSVAGSITPSIIMSLAASCKDGETSRMNKLQQMHQSPDIRESLRQRGLGVLLECSP